METLKEQIHEDEAVKKKFSFAFNKSSKSKKYKKQVEELEDKVENMKL